MNGFVKTKTPLAVIADRLSLDLTPVSVIRDVVGVYVLMAGDEAVYVGQSKRVLSRLSWQFRRFAGRFDRVLIAEVALSELDRVEAELINGLYPKFNVIYPVMSRFDGSRNKTEEELLNETRLVLNRVTESMMAGIIKESA
jgi:hypothetical protein